MALVDLANEYSEHSSVKSRAASSPVISRTKFSMLQRWGERQLGTSTPGQCKRRSVLDEGFVVSMPSRATKRDQKLAKSRTHACRPCTISFASRRNSSRYICLSFPQRAWPGLTEGRFHLLCSATWTAEARCASRRTRTWEARLKCCHTATHPGADASGREAARLRQGPSPGRISHVPVHHDAGVRWTSQAQMVRRGSETAGYRWRSRQIPHSHQPMQETWLSM